jgi:hypothetical protein
MAFVSVSAEKCGTVNRSALKKSSFLEHSVELMQTEILWISALARFLSM